MRLTWLLCVAGAAASEAKKKPTNFVVLFLDDHGWGDAGVNVASVAGLPPVTETPRIDRMAAEGVRFADFHAGYSVCTASRGALLTGRLSPRTGVANNFGPHSIHGMNINEKTIADVLGDHGYESHMIGKWHLGHNAPYNPTWRGFHSWVGLPYSGDMGCLDVEQTELGQNGGLSQSCLSQSWSEKGQPACPVLCKYNHRSVDRRSYNDDPTGNRLGGDDVAVGEDLAWSPTPAPLSGRDNHNPDTAIPLFGAMAPNCSGYADCGRTITLAPFDPFQLSNTYKARAAEIFAMFGKNGSKSGTPFFLYVAFAHTHTPLAYPPEFNEASPRPGRLKVFGNTLAEADHTIGAILDSLDAAGLGEDTLVFLSADNGPANLGSVACEVKGSPGPYTGDWMRKPVGPDPEDPQGGGGGGTEKGTTWEGGHRVVGLARWGGEGVSKLSNPGRTSKALAQTIDFMPTFVSLAGGALPTDRAYDGVDLTKVLLDGDDSAGHHTLFHPHGAPKDSPSCDFACQVGVVPAMRLGKYKVHFVTAGAGPCRFWNGTHGPLGAPRHHDPPLVFDVDTDPAESTPIDVDGAMLQQINRSYASFWASVLGESSYPRVTDYSQNISFRPCGNRSSSVCRTNSPIPLE